MRKLIIIFNIVVLSAGIMLFSGCGKETEPEGILICDMTVAQDTAELDLQGKQNVDANAIIQLNSLKKLNVQDTNLTYDEINALKMTMPDCDVLYSIIIGANTYPSDTLTIDLSQTKIEDIDTAISELERFEWLNTVKLDCDSISAEDYKALSEKLTEINFIIDIDIFGDIYSQESSIIDLANTADVDVDELINKMEYISEVAEVDFGETQLTVSEMDALLGAYPETEFLWNVSLLGEVITPQTSEMDIAGQAVEDYDAFFETFRFLPNVTYIDMCDCGLTNDQMEKLTIAYPDTKFVWKVTVGYWELRTDIKAFSTGKRIPWEGGTFLGGGTRVYNEDAANLKYCTDLIALDIGHKTDVTDFSFLQYTPKLQYLIVAMTGIDDLSALTGLEDLMYLEVFSTRIKDLSPLLELENLKHLNISTTDFESSDPLFEMTQLERLWIVSTPITKSEREALYEALPDTEIVHYTTNPTTGGWRGSDCQTYIDMQALFELPTAFSD